MTHWHDDEMKLTRCSPTKAKSRAAVSRVAIFDGDAIAPDADREIEDPSPSGSIQMISDDNN